MNEASTRIRQFENLVSGRYFFKYTHTTLAKSNTYGLPTDLHTNEIFCLNLFGFMRQPHSFMSRNNTECIKTLTFEKNGCEIGKKAGPPTKGYRMDFFHKAAASKREKGCTL